MTILIVVCAVLGMILGRYLKVLILVPAIFCVLGISIGRSIYFEHGLLRLLIEFAAAVTSLEVGYAAILFPLSIKHMFRSLNWHRRKATPDTSSRIIAARQR